MIWIEVYLLWTVHQVGFQCQIFSYQFFNMKNMLLNQIRKLKQTKSQKQIRPPPIRQFYKEDKVSERSQSNTRSLKNKTQITNNKLDIFKGMTFCFPVVDIDLSPKRIECMTKSIIQTEGKVIQFKDSQLQQSVDYLLVNPKTIITQLLRKVHNKIIFKQILDYNFILRSLREETLLCISNYSLHKARQDEQNQDQEERTVTMSMMPQKIVKGLGYLHYRTATFESHHQKQQYQDIPTDGQQEQQTKTLIIKNKTTEIPFTQAMDYQDFPQPKKINRQAFLCQKKPNNQTFSTNKFICEELMKLQKIYQSQRDIGRKIAYLKAVSAIKSLDREIESERDLDNLRGVGSKIIGKVKELLHTGKLSKLQKLKTSQKRVVMQQFNKIWGVGPSKAEQLYQLGIKSIQTLKGRTQLLNRNQKVGLKYFQDLKQKIPREKVAKIFDFIKEVFAKHVECRSLYHFEVCGSYRRGRSHCGDIDILISRKDGVFEKKLLLTLVLELENAGLLTDHLVFPSAAKDHTSLSYMGICQFQEQIHHRIDFKYYHINEYPYALLYFTGSDMFNRSMRLYASKLGIQLNDHGAIAKRRNDNDQFWNKPIPICKDQEDIFNFLEMEYKTPEQRDV